MKDKALEKLKAMVSEYAKLQLQIREKNEILDKIAKRVITYNKR